MLKTRMETGGTLASGIFTNGRTKLNTLSSSGMAEITVEDQETSVQLTSVRKECGTWMAIVSAVMSSRFSRQPTPPPRHVQPTKTQSSATFSWTPASKPETRLPPEHIATKTTKSRSFTTPTLPAKEIATWNSALTPTAFALIKLAARPSQEKTSSTHFGSKMTSVETVYRRLSPPATRPS